MAAGGGGVPREIGPLAGGIAAASPPPLVAVVGPGVAVERVAVGRGAADAAGEPDAEAAGGLAETAAPWDASGLAEAAREAAGDADVEPPATITTWSDPSSTAAA